MPTTIKAIISAFQIDLHATCYCNTLRLDGAKKFGSGMPIYALLIVAAKMESTRKAKTQTEPYFSGSRSYTNIFYLLRFITCSQGYCVQPLNSSF